MAGRTHYDVLGVTPDAKADAIRRAYLRQARRWHPDRPSGDSEQMRVVNEAWQVLGDLRSRAAYDRARARAAPRPASSRPQAGTPRPPSGPTRPSAGSPPPESSSPPLEVISIRWRWVSLAAAALVALALVLIFVAASTTEDSDSATPITASAPVSVSRPEPGDCFIFGISTLITVGCNHPHDGKLVSWVPLGAPCPPDTKLDYVRSAQEAVCYLIPSG